ncbi:MAG: glutamate formiminotransferase [Actinomycetota bacterium]|nr:glutamate formiminotransferase [Actinomycetota bacterium]
MTVLECVINVSEGRRSEVIDALAGAARPYLLDVHVDPDHHRTVLTLAGDDALVGATRRVAGAAVAWIDLRHHAGAHPRLGAVDVVPFVPLDGSTMADALAARAEFAAWAGSELGVPCFFYGPDLPRSEGPLGPGRTLPEVRRSAFTTVAPDAGPSTPHPTAGAICVGARPILVAYNVWLAPGTPVETARAVAAAVRGPALRALGLDVGGQAQVSMNLIAPEQLSPADAYDAVAALTGVARAELVGLLPRAVLEAIPAERWPELDLSPSRTIEARVG